MNNHEHTKIELIQCNLSSEAIAPIKENIRNLIPSIDRPDVKLIPDDYDLHITSRTLGAREGLPVKLRGTLLAIKLNQQGSYIEIFSDGTMTQLTTFLPQLRGTAIAEMIHAEARIKWQNLTVEQEKRLDYTPVCSKVRQEIIKRNKPISKVAPYETLRNSICVPEHGFAISSFQDSSASLATVGLAACIGLVVINPTKKRAAIAHLDLATIETYKTSLQFMFAMVTDKKDKCQIYLIGGSPLPKEECGRPGSETYKAAFKSETLACSIRDFLQDYPSIDISTDMFHKKRRAAFAVQLYPDKPAELLAISDDDVNTYEYEEHKTKLYHKNMMTGDPTFYQQLQEYSSDPNFLGRRLWPPRLLEE